MEELQGRYARTTLDAAAILNKRNRPKMTQTAIWLSVEVHDRIKREAGPRGLGEEIRTRLDEWQAFHDAGLRVSTVREVTRLSEGD